MIILENYRDKTNFPENSIEIAKCFTIKISRYLLLLSQVTFTISIIRYGFGSSLPSSTAKNIRVHPNGDLVKYFQMLQHLEKCGENENIRKSDWYIRTEI